MKVWALGTNFLVGRRSLMRRLCTVCIVILGIHVGAHELESVLLTTLDHLDLYVDSAFKALLAFSERVHLNSLARASLRIIELMETEEKQTLAKGGSIAIELLCVFFVTRGLWPLADNTKALKPVVSHRSGVVNLLGLSLLMAGLLLPFSGIMVAALAAETQLAQLLSPLGGRAEFVAAGLSAFCAVAMWLRLIPSLLLGLVRGLRDGGTWWTNLPVNSGPIAWARGFFTGWWIGLIVLPPTLMTFMSPQRLFALFIRAFGGGL